MSEGKKHDLCLRALGLLDEQLEARVVHYKADLETSPELDAITAQVVAQLKVMQQSVTKEAPARQSAEEIEAQAAHPSNCSAGLPKDGNRLRGLNLHRRAEIAKLFFESELHENTKGDRTVLHPAEQACTTAPSLQNRLRAELEGFEYSIADQELTLPRCRKSIAIAGAACRGAPELNRVRRSTGF